MKVAFVSLMNGVPWGGSEELWYRAAKLALSKGHSVGTLTRKWEKTPDKIVELKQLGVDTKFYYKPGQSLINKIAVKLGLKQGLFEIIPDLDADIYIMSNGTTFDFLYYQAVTDYILKTGKPYIVISQHGFENGHLVNPAQRIYSIKFFEKSKRNFFVAERNLATAERQMAHNIGKAQVISNPINIRQIGVKPFPSSETLFIACVARMDCSFKGQDILLQTLSSEKWRHRKYFLKLYGAGPHQEHLTRLIQFYSLQQNVSIEGHVQDIDRIWDTNHVLVLPSLSEGTPLALIEAMLSGRPAVATDVGDNGKYVLDNHTGFLADTASVKSLSDSLEALWNNKENLHTMGQNAFDHSKKVTNLHPEEALISFIETLNECS